MKPELILQSDILDIVFENRNKEYGAYVLRRSYNKVLKQSVSAMLAIVFFFAAIISWKKKPDWQTLGSLTPKDTIMLTEITQPPPPPPPTPPPPANRSIRHVDVRITPDESDPIPTVEELDAPVLIDTETRDGVDSEIVSPVADVPATGTQPAPEPAPAPVTPFRSVEEMPSFPGGEQALRRFLGKNLRVPDDELEAGARVVVRAQFIVDTIGNVTAIELLQSGGNKFDAEVRRVLYKMPKWKPGKQNGRTVPVYFVVPVVFQGEEE